jgi:cytochrome-b5 reductase
MTLQSRRRLALQMIGQTRRSQPSRWIWGATTGIDAAGKPICFRKSLVWTTFLTVHYSASIAAAMASSGGGFPESTYLSSLGKIESIPLQMPQRRLVPPGQCQFGPDPVTVPLLERVRVSPTSFVLRFGLPDRTKPLGLSTCACLLAVAPDGVNPTLESQDPVVRPYTPISTNAMIGTFDLLVKNYPEYGIMSKYLCETLPVTTNDDHGLRIAFKHIDFNVKIQASEFSKYNTVAMIAGGTGITPMIQALHAILGEDEHGETNPRPNVILLYGSKNEQDILGKELLDHWASLHPAQFKVVHVLSDEPSDNDWAGERGFIDEACIRKYFPMPHPDNPHEVLVLVCGPPPMYNALTGPRESKELSGVLSSLGYQADHVYKF